MRTHDTAHQLNQPMVDRIRQCAADTSSSWIGAMTLYPPEARQLVALIDEGREITDLAAAVPVEVRPAFVQAVKSARAVADGDIRQLHAKIVKLHDEVEQLRAQLATGRAEYEPAVPVPEPVTPHPDWAKHVYGCGGGRQCRCVIPEPDVRPDPDQALQGGDVR